MPLFWFAASTRGHRASKRRVPGTLTAGVERLEQRLALTLGAAAAPPLPAYDIGTPAMTDIWVDPISGDDTHDGATRDHAVRTVTEAWARVPVGIVLSHGYRINLVSGTYAEAVVPNYWENRFGTHDAPVQIRAADGVGTARLPTMNIFGCRSIYLDGLDVSAGGGDVLHFEACSQVLIRDTTVRGVGTIATYAVPQEALKVNQCRDIFIEHCDISGAWDNAVDFVAVQNGHVVGSLIHRSGDWAMYAKGGSADLVITGNQFYDAGTGGFTAGQGTGFEFMVAPWLQYEATGITFTNNVIHDTEGAGIGVNGGANIVMTNNTLYHVGTRSHVIEVGFGSRSCDGDRVTCTAYLARGGWGTNVPGQEEPIPNKNVIIANNVVLNSDGVASQWQQFSIALPRTPSPGSNIPSPARADDGLQIFGNVIWNGPVDHPLGIESPTLAAAVLARNTINTVRPVLVNPAQGDYRLMADPSLPSEQPIPPLPPSVPPVPAAPVTAAFRVVGAVVSRTITSVVVQFSRRVSGVTLDDFVLRRGRVTVSLAGSRITTVDNRTFTISSIRGTNLAGNYTLQLQGAGTGIVDSSGIAFARPTAVSWRMIRTLPVR